MFDEMEVFKNVIAIDEMGKNQLTSKNSKINGEIGMKFK